VGTPSLSANTPFTNTWWIPTAGVASCSNVAESQTEAGSKTQTSAHIPSASRPRSNAPIHLIALARHAGVELTIDDWQRFGFDIPLLVNLQPAGEYLGEDYYRAGGVSAVVGELMRGGLIHEQALTATVGRGPYRPAPGTANMLVSDAIPFQRARRRGRKCNARTLDSWRPVRFSNRPSSIRSWRRTPGVPRHSH
jgi:hypothetical protein